MFPFLHKTNLTSKQHQVSHFLSEFSYSFCLDRATADFFNRHSARIFRETRELRVSTLQTEFVRNPIFYQNYS